MQAVPGFRTTYEILTAGAGDQAVSKGNTVTMQATGVVSESGKQFWSTKDAGQQPFTYQAGVGGVITGWDQGCLGMQIGEVRQLEIPSNEGYGAKGFPAWGIPPHGDLRFEIEVLSIKGKAGDLLKIPGIQTQYKIIKPGSGRGVVSKG